MVVGLNVSLKKIAGLDASTEACYRPGIPNPKLHLEYEAKFPFFQ